MRNRLTKEQKLLHDKFQEILDTIAANKKANKEKEKQRAKIRELRQPFVDELQKQQAALKAELEPIHKKYDPLIQEKENERKKLEEQYFIENKSRDEITKLLIKFDVQHLASLKSEKRLEEQKVKNKYPEIQSLDDQIGKYNQEIIAIPDEELPHKLLIETMDAMFAVKQKGQSLPPIITPESLIKIFSVSPFALGKWIDNPQIYERLTTGDAQLWQDYYERLLRRDNPDAVLKSVFAKVEAYGVKNPFYLNLTRVELALGAMTKYMDKYQGASEGKKQEQLSRWQEFKRWWGRTTSPKGFEQDRIREFHKTHQRVERLATYEKKSKRNPKNKRTIDLTGEKDQATSKKVEASTLNFNSLQLGIQDLAGQIEIIKKKIEEIRSDFHSELMMSLGNLVSNEYTIIDEAGNEIKKEVQELDTEGYMERYPKIYAKYKEEIAVYENELKKLEEQKAEFEQDLRKYLVDGLEVVDQTLEKAKDKKSEEHILTEHHLFSSHRISGASPHNLLKQLKSAFENLLQSLPEPKEEKTMKPKDEVRIIDEQKEEVPEGKPVLSMEEDEAPIELPSTILRIK